MSLDLSGSSQLARPIDDVAELVAYLRSAEKPPELWRIGVEHEKVGVLLPGLAPVPYEGERSIRALLAALSAGSGGAQSVHEEAGNPIALLSGEASVTLEPGGQLELSGSPLRTLVEVRRELEQHLAAVRAQSNRLGMRWLALGYRPTSTTDGMPWMPKLRYAEMRRSLGPRGRLALDMMLMTATVQANLDWSNEADLASKVRAATSASPLVTALFANSAIVNGKESGYLDYRYQVWRETDPARCGLLEQMVQPGWGYGAYVDWALDVPLLFARHNGRYLAGKGQTFRSWLQTGKLGSEPLRPTMSAWVDHLTTVFPEVRVKKVLELRGADCVPLPHLLALPAIWMGLLYDPSACEATWELTSRWTFAERLDFQADVARNALRARGPGGTRANELCGKMLAIARRGLGAWAKVSGADERSFLDPLESMLRDGRTLAERSLETFKAANRDPASLIPGWSIA